MTSSPVGGSQQPPTTQPRSDSEKKARSRARALFVGGFALFLGALTSDERAVAMGGLDAVALVSGGKDSVMAAMMAESYGHRVVALANLLPADVAVEELDSHCFQTVGHRAVAAYGELTGLPLFRRRLRGSSKHTEMTYEIGSSTSAGDEVEDLRALLAAVVEKMPTVRAVTAGAILSDYQRLRVEAVCADLGLVSLAYLWRQPQPLMLETMCASDVDAILVKVAAMGLTPAKHLGRSLAEMRPTLYRIEREFGSHCCGEGGEFETLTLDCPFFRRARLVIRPDGAPPRRSSSPPRTRTPPRDTSPSNATWWRSRPAPPPAGGRDPEPPAPRGRPGGGGERRRGRRRGRWRCGRSITRGRGDRRGVPRAAPARDATRAARRRRRRRRRRPGRRRALPWFARSAVPPRPSSTSALPSPPRTRRTPRAPPRRAPRRGYTPWRLDSARWDSIGPRWTRCNCTSTTCRTSPR